MNHDLHSAVGRFQTAAGRAPIILIDMDEVLCRWEEYFVASHRKMFPHLPIPDAGQREGFDLFYGLSPERRHATAAVLDEPGFFAELEPVVGAIEAIRDMQGMGMDVALCTSPWLSNPTCASDKFRWVQRHLGSEMAEATVVTRDKTRVRGDVLIDDKPDIKGRTEPEWDLIRFTYHYNRNLPGPRIQGWSNWQPTLGPILQSKADQRNASQLG